MMGIPISIRWHLSVNRGPEYAPTHTTQILCSWKNLLILQSIDSKCHPLLTQVLPSMGIYQGMILFKNLLLHYVLSVEMRQSFDQFSSPNDMLTTTISILYWIEETKAIIVHRLINIWVRSRNCGCLVTWFCYQLIAKPGNKTATVSWPDPYTIAV